INIVVNSVETERLSHFPGAKTNTVLYCTAIFPRRVIRIAFTRPPTHQTARGANTILRRRTESCASSGENTGDFVRGKGTIVDSWLINESIKEPIAPYWKASVGADSDRIGCI